MLAPILAAALALFPVDRPSHSGQSRPAGPGPILAEAGAPVQAPDPVIPPGTLSRLFVDPDGTSRFVVPAPEQPDGKKMVVGHLRPGPPQHKVVCGMTLIIVDSQIDPKFVVSPKAGAGEFTIRRVPKPMCGDGKK